MKLINIIMLYFKYITYIDDFTSKGTGLVNVTIEI